MKLNEAILMRSTYSEKSFEAMKEQFRLSDISKTSRSLCGPTSLQAFGICYSDSDKELKIHEVESELIKAGYKVKSEPRFAFRGYTLGRFIEEHPKGSFILGTSDHVMAYIDGELTDTYHTKRALHKKLLHVIEVTR